MTRKQKNSSKKQPKPRKRAAPSSSSEAEMPPAPAGPASDRDSHGYSSDASLPIQHSEPHRSLERTSPSSFHERSHRSSPERTPSPRRSERSSRHSSRSSRHSSALEAAELSEEDLQFVSHQTGQWEVYYPPVHRFSNPSRLFKASSS